MKRRIVVNGVIGICACIVASVQAAEREVTPEEFREKVRQYDQTVGNMGTLRNRAVAPQIPKGAEQFNRALTIHNNKKATARELKEAASLYQAAYDAGIPQASVNLAMLYLEGKGVKKDVKKAISLLESASKKDIPQADMSLASLYLNGKGLKRDEKKGEWHLNKAARTKNPNAVKMLADYMEWKKKNELAMKQFQENMKKIQLSPSRAQTPQFNPSQTQTISIPSTGLPFQRPAQFGAVQKPGLFMPTIEQILGSATNSQPTRQPSRDAGADMKKGTSTGQTETDADAQGSIKPTTEGK